jgi:hypothetical protein
VSLVYSSRRGSRDIEHIGSAHDDAELELLKAAARQRLTAGQGELDLGLDAGGQGGRPVADHFLADGLPARCPGACLRRAGLRRGSRRQRGVPAAGAGPDHLAGQQARQPAGPRGGGRRRGVVPDRAAAPARLCETGVPAGAVRCRR